LWGIFVLLPFIDFAGERFSLSVFADFRPLSTVVASLPYVQVVSYFSELVFLSV